LVNPFTLFEIHEIASPFLLRASAFVKTSAHKTADQAGSQ